MELKEIASTSDLVEIKIEAFKNSRINFQTLDSIDENTEETILIKIPNEGASYGLNSSIVHDLSTKLRSKPALIIQESFCEATSKIYWKSAEVEDFLTLKPNEKIKTEAVRKLNEFLVDFLINSIKNNHLGKFLILSKTQN